MRTAFLGFVLDTQARELTRGSAPVRLSPKAFRLLEVLIAEQPRAIGRRELMDRVWPATHVVEAHLSNLIGELRSALGDDPKAPRAIRTVSRFGYAFVAASTTPAVATTSKRTAAWELTWSGGRVVLAEGQHVIGRGDDVAVRLESSRVSRRHARVTVAAGGLTYEDLESKNGTFDDGRQVDREMPVADGQTLVIGDVEVLFRRPRRHASTSSMTFRTRARLAGDTPPATISSRRGRS